MILGVGVVWPFLFIIPGWIAVRRVAPDVPIPGALGIAVVASVYLSAHVVNGIARVVGFGLPAVLVSALLLAAASAGFAMVEHRWLAPFTRPTLAGIRETLRFDLHIWLLGAGMAGLVGTVLFANGWREADGVLISGGWNWSDLLVHVAIGSSIVHGNFPPEVPYFAGVPLTYHWFADFHGAIAATASGLPLIPVYFVTSALFAGVLPLVVWALALRLTGDQRVAILATILVCLGGGLGWIRLAGDLADGGALWDLLAQNPYDNDWRDEWPFFRIASVLGTGFFPHRATTLGLPGFVSVILLVVSCLGVRPAGVLLAGLLAALLAPFHFYAFPAVYLVVALYVVVSGGWRDAGAWRDAVLFLAPVVLAIPFIADAAVRQSDAGAFRLVPGWTEARFRDGPLAVLFFYATNLGIPFLLACLAALRGRGHGPPARAFLVAWMATLFLVPNLIVVSAVDFDMNKYFQMMWIATAVLAAWLIRDWPRGVRYGLVALSAISPILIAWWHLVNPAVVMTSAQAAAGRWMEANLPERAVVVTDAFINSPVDLAGRLRVTTFGPYVSNLGYDPTTREADVRAIYCEGGDAAARLMGRYDASYVLSPGTPLDCELTDFDSSGRFESVYAVDGVTIWRLVDRLEQ